MNEEHKKKYQAIQDANVDPFKQRITCTCSKCGRTASLLVEMSMRLKPGDSLYVDPYRDDWGRCHGCRRKTLVVSEVPTSIPEPKPIGFWKVPTADGSSSGTKTEK